MLLSSRKKHTCNFIGVHVAQILVCCVMYYLSWFVLLSFFSFGYCIVCPSFGYCIVCPSSFGYCIVCTFLLAIVLSVLLRFSASDYSLVSSNFSYVLWLDIRSLRLDVYVYILSVINNVVSMTNS